MKKNILLVCGEFKDKKLKINFNSRRNDEKVKKKT